MEFGPYQLQIFVSLVVILGAAFVALICDFLKGNNEQLRELAIELKVRRDEDQRRAQMMIAQPAQAVAQAMTRSAVAAPAAKAESEPVEKRVEAPPIARSMAASVAARAGKRMPSPDAIAAMERGAQLAGSPRAQSPAAQRMAAAAANTPRPQSQPAPEVVATPVIEVKQGPVAVARGKKDWNSLLARRTETVRTAAQPVAAEADLLQAVVAETTTQREQETTLTSEFPAGFPSGFYDGFFLSRLVQTRRPVSGLVVSIGVNTPRNADGSLPESVSKLIQSLIGPDDFACQSNEEEFLLIYPSERGASAQRRLSQISQQLWDFQLRSLGTFSILFSWGGVEVRSESIVEAIASANERMQETRRGRKLVTMELRNEMPLRQAV